MNIFYLDDNPRLSAQQLCDKHVPKMLLETCQMLSTGIRSRLEVKTDSLYKIAYPKHPSTMWVGESRKHFMWALEYARAVADEYTWRYGKMHKSERVVKWLEDNKEYIFKAFEDVEPIFTRPPQCMPDQYKQEDTIEAYRSYYYGEKKYFAKWEKGRNKPEWFRGKAIHEAFKTKNETANATR